MSDTTKKRYAFIPLEEAKKETSLKGEILVNRETGHFFVKDDFGNIKSATQNLETKLNEIIDNSYFEQTDGKYNTTRKAYKDKPWKYPAAKIALKTSPVPKKFCG